MVNGWLVFSDGLGEDITVGQMFVQNAKDLVVKFLVTADAFHHLFQRLKLMDKVRGKMRLLELN